MMSRWKTSKGAQQVVVTDECFDENHARCPIKLGAGYPDWAVYSCDCHASR
jgi:hypothetical protein